MNDSRWSISVIYAVLLAACTYFAWQQLFGAMFVIGETDRSPGLLDSALLILTALGTLGLAIAAIGAFSRMRAFGFLGLASAIAVLYMAAAFAWQEYQYIMLISRSNGPWIRQLNPLPSWEDRVKSFLPLALDLAAILVSWLWLRQIARDNTKGPQKSANPLP